jgi:hypothetical protein
LNTSLFTFHNTEPSLLVFLSSFLVILRARNTYAQPGAQSTAPQSPLSDSGGCRYGQRLMVVVVSDESEAAILARRRRVRVATVQLHVHHRVAKRTAVKIVESYAFIVNSCGVNMCVKMCVVRIASAPLQRKTEPPVEMNSRQS